MDPKFLRNLRMSKKHNKKAKKDEWNVPSLNLTLSVL